MRSGPSALRNTKPSPKKRASAVAPRYTVQNDDGVSFVDVELPGVAKESVTVEVNGRTLCISGDRIVRQRAVSEDAGRGEPGQSDAPVDAKEGASHGAEGTGSKTPTVRQDATESDAAGDAEGVAAAGERVVYKAEFSLPASADCAKVSADFHDGLLEVRIPRKQAESHRVSVNIL